MPYCPKCRTEYEEGYTVCADCHTPLVASLVCDNLTKVYSFKSKQVSDRFTEYLNYAHFKTRTEENAETGQFDLYAAEADISSIKHAYSVFVSMEAEKRLKQENETGCVSENCPEDDADSACSASEPDFSEELFDEESVQEMSKFILRAPSKQYESADFRAKDNLSMGIVMIVFGIICLFYSIFRMHQFQLIVMCLFSTALILGGIYSVVRSVRLRKSSDIEKQTLDSIRTWQSENLKKSALLEEAADAESPEEQILLCEMRIREKTRAAFPDTDEAILDFLTDEYVSKLFDEA